MKKLALITLLIINYAFGQVKPGDAVPNIDFHTLLNAPVKSTSLSSLKGKVVLLEFWATWCGSCIVAMPHLQELQHQYKGRLQVIAINDETVARTQKFLRVRPSNYWFAVDTNGDAGKQFPHSLIPHTVVIGPDGRLIGNTDPESVTAKVIDSILNKQAVHLPEKKDNLTDYHEIIKKYFSAADTVKSRFMMLPEMKGSPGLSTTWLNDNTFKGRRLTCLNLQISALYRLAYGDFPYSRTIDSTGEGNKAPVYCLDIITEQKADLLPELRKNLARRFDLQASIVQKNRDVYVLSITDPEKFKTIPLNKSGERTYYSRHGEIDQQSITMADFADYLESYGTGSLPVIDETGSKAKFDIKFSFQPEDPTSLTNILNSMGLKLEKQKRTIDMLLLYKQKSA